MPGAAQVWSSDRSTPSVLQNRREHAVSPLSAWRISRDPAEGHPIKMEKRHAVVPTD